MAADRVSDALQAGDLVRVRSRFEPPSEPVHIIYPSARLVAAKLRAFVDYAGPRLQAAREQLELPAADIHERR